MSKEQRKHNAVFKEKTVELSYACGSVVKIWRESDAYGRNSFPSKGNP